MCLIVIAIATFKDDCIVLTIVIETALSSLQDIDKQLTLAGEAFLVSSD